MLKITVDATAAWRKAQLTLPKGYEDRWRELYADVKERQPALGHDEVLDRATDMFLDELWEDDVVADELLFHSWVSLDIDDITVVAHDVQFADEPPTFDCVGQQSLV